MKPFNQKSRRTVMTQALVWSVLAMIGSGLIVHFYYQSILKELDLNTEVCLQHQKTIEQEDSIFQVAQQSIVDLEKSFMDLKGLNKNYIALAVTHDYGTNDVLKNIKSQAEIIDEQLKDLRFFTRLSKFKELYQLTASQFQTELLNENTLRDNFVRNIPPEPDSVFEATCELRLQQKEMLIQQKEIELAGLNSRLGVFEMRVQDAKMRNSKLERDLDYQRGEVEKWRNASLTSTKAIDKSPSTPPKSTEVSNLLNWWNSIQMTTNKKGKPVSLKRIDLVYQGMNNDKDVLKELELFILKLKTP